MPNFGLEVAIAKMIDDIIPDDVVRQERAVKGVVAEDATVLPEALANLPWQRADIYIPGPAVVGNGVARAAFPQGAVIRHVSIFAKTAPSGTYNATIVSPSGSEAFSLQAGSQVGMEKMNLRVPNGGWVTVNVTSAGGAEDITLVLHYSSFGYTSGSASGGGSSGGGGGGTISVISVNGKTGTVELNADDISDTATSHKFVSADDITKLANLSGVNTGDQDLSGYVLASSLSLVATSGDYDDLGNKPTLGSAASMSASSFATATQGAKADTAVQPGDIAPVATSGDYEDLENKPTIPAQFNPIAGTNMSITGTYPDITFSASGGGGGGGAVDSVNGETGHVMLDADDIDDASTSHKFATAAELAKLDGIAAGAEVNVQSDWNATSGDAHILNKPTEFPPAPHNHDSRYYTQSEVDSIVAAAIAAIFVPQTLHGLSQLTVVGSAAGTYVQDSPSTTLVFSGLNPSRLYQVSATIGILTTGSTVRAFRCTFQAIGATTVTPTPGSQNASYHNQKVSDITAATLYPDASGEIVVKPAFMWVSGTVTASHMSITATIN